MFIVHFTNDLVPSLTLPETNKSHRNLDGWKAILSLLGPSQKFRGRTVWVFLGEYSEFPWKWPRISLKFPVAFQHTIPYPSIGPIFTWPSTHPCKAWNKHHGLCWGDMCHEANFNLKFVLDLFSCFFWITFCVLLTEFIYRCVYIRWIWLIT